MCIFNEVPQTDSSLLKMTIKILIFVALNVFFSLLSTSVFIISYFEHKTNENMRYKLNKLLTKTNGMHTHPSHQVYKSSMAD